jgi:outer membrane PBP1 activator LpoA protein
MTAPSDGHDADGGRQPDQKAAQSGLSIKGRRDLMGGKEKMKEAGSKAPGIDQVFKKMGAVIDKRKEELVGSNKDNLTIMKETVDRREADVMKIEQKINEAQDKGSKSILEIQLKAAQKELKDALVNLSMVDKASKPKKQENSRTLSI